MYRPRCTAPDIQDLVRNSTDAFFYNRENETTNMTEDYESDKYNDTTPAFSDEVMDVYVGSMINVEDGLKLNMLKILVNFRDRCVADSSTERNLQDIEQTPQDDEQHPRSNK